MKYKIAAVPNMDAMILSASLEWLISVSFDLMLWIDYTPLVLCLQIININLE